MKRIIYIILAWSSLTAYAQEEDFTIPKVEDMVSVPPSPEAQAFTKYGNLPVSLYTGSPDIKIPIHTLKGREIEIPINLSYDASGVKVTQLATWVGLGWNLSAGGAVTRQINGMPDDYITWTGTGYGLYYDAVNRPKFEEYKNWTPLVGQEELTPKIQDHYEFIRDVKKGKIETQPDSYSFSVNGLSGTIFIDYENNKAYCIDQPDLLVVPAFTTASGGNTSKIINQWTITGKNGTKYTFGKVEKTEVFQTTGSDESQEGIRTYHSAWFLTEIRTKNSVDVIKFNYTTPVLWNQKQLAGAGEVRREMMDQNCSDYGSISAMASEYKIYQFELSNIEVNGHVEMDFTASQQGRIDLFGKKSLDSIRVYDHKLNRIKLVDLKNDAYFGVADTTDDRKSRLKLTGVDIFGKTGNTTPVESYTFDYHESSNFPSRSSKAQDYWGYYNGQNGNDNLNLNKGTLIPYMAEFDDDNPGFDGANREVSLTHAVVGSLKKITYPLGGSTEFFYKLHREGTNTLNSYTEDYTAASVFLTGAIDNTDPYGYGPCDDLSLEKPTGLDYGFWLEESGDVNIKFNVYAPGGLTSNGVGYVALYKTGEGCYVFPTGTICDAGAPRPFCDVFNDGTVPYEQYGNFIAPYSSQLTMQLDSGYYHVVMLNSNEEVTLHLEIEATRTVIEEITGKNVGGLRTFKMVDKTDGTNVARTKYVFYNDLSGTDPSTITETYLTDTEATSGVSHMPLYMHDTYRFLNQANSCSYLNRYSSSLATQVSPHITYSAVTELEFANGTFNGMQVHSFHNEQRARLFHSAAKEAPLNGKLLSRKVYALDAGTLKLQEHEQNTYTLEAIVDVLNDPISVSGLKMHATSDEMTYLLIKPVPGSTPGKQTFEYKSGFFGGLLGSDVIKAREMQQYCTDSTDMAPGNLCIPGPMNNDQKLVFGFSSWWVKHTNRLLTQIDQDGHEIKTNTDNVFGNSTHFQLTETKTLDSRGAEYKTVFVYPQDTLSLPGMAGLVSGHRIGEVVRKSVFNAGDPVFTKETTYTTSGLTRPESMKFSFGGGLEEERLRIHRYDSYSNILEVSRTDDHHVSYVWGYNNRYPIAKVVNATYSEIENAIGISELSSLNANSLTDDQIRTKVAALRTALPAAMVTTYTYYPNTGLNSITDPNGEETKFEYDDYNRFHYSIDDEGNVLAMNDYNVSQGYLRSHGYLTPRTTLPTESSSMALDNDLVSINTQYVDGLGRPIQTVTKRASFGNKDIIQHLEYDGFGREVKQYLPYTYDTTGVKKINPLTDANGQKAFHNSLFGGTSGDYAYSESLPEQSPLGRVLETYAPGEPWNKSAGNKPVTTTYRTNTAADQVRIWEISTTQDPVTGFGGEYNNATVHGEGTLHVTETTDENGHKTLEFKDKLGRVVLKKVQEGQNAYLSTYYVYDNLNNLRYVLPPEAVKAGEAIGNKISTAILNNFCFAYEYDQRNRMITKKVPGADSVAMVYDKLDRLIMTQDGEQRNKGDWTFTKYDELNRPAITGIFTDDSTNHDRAYHQNRVDAMLIFNLEFDDEQANSIKEGVFIEASQYDGVSSTYRAEQYINLQPGFIYSGTSGSFMGEIQNPIPNIDGGWVDIYYDKTYPDIAHSQVLTVNFYDNYDFTNETFTLPSGVFTAIDGELPTSTLAVKGQMTGNKTRILGTDDYITSVNFYDDKYQVTQTVTVNHKGGRDVLTSHYDFAGRLRKTHLDHFNQSADLTATTVVMNYTYDHGGRLLTVDHSVNGEAAKTLAENTYNELGELKDKQVGDAHQTINYLYNMRGWLTHINDPATSGNDYFSMQLMYDNATDAQHNGNIGEIVWRDQFEKEQKTYKYGYDYLNRLSAADYSALKDPMSGQGAQLVDVNNFQVFGITYDGNGNIMSLNRKSKGVTMDSLQYEYTNGNQLSKVTDDSQNSEGFKDGDDLTTEYEYDANGNMIEDKNKGITSITYNHLNLPKKVTFDANKYIEYTYDAAGMKLSQKVVDGSTTKVTDYIGGFIYEDNKLQLVQHDEGRITRENAAWDYQYHLKDHLGNVRTTFTTNPDPDDTYLATMEIENNSTESQYFSNLTTAHVNLLANHTPNGNESALLDNGSPIGPAIMLPVVPGDTIDLEVYAYYEGGSGYSNSAGVTGFTAALAGAFGGLNGGTAEQQSVFDGINDFLSGLGSLNGTGNDNVPAAYLNYILVDQDHEYITAGWQQVSSAANFNLEQISLNNIQVSKAGYVYIYVSMESNTTHGVFFDDLKVTHKHSNVVQMDNYYPFGLTFNSYQKVGTQENSFKYNGKEVVDELGCNLLDYGARMYDPTLARWNNVDALANEYMDQGPYNYALNNPVIFIDPDGNKVIPFGLSKSHFGVYKKAVEMKTFSSVFARLIESEQHTIRLFSSNLNVIRSTKKKGITTYRASSFHGQSDYQFSRSQEISTYFVDARQEQGVSGVHARIDFNNLFNAKREDDPNSGTEGLQTAGTLFHEMWHVNETMDGSSYSNKGQHNSMAENANYFESKMDFLRDFKGAELTDSEKTYHKWSGLTYSKAFTDRMFTEDGSLSEEGKAYVKARNKIDLKTGLEKE